MKESCVARRQFLLLGRREKFPQKVGRREIYPPVPSPSIFVFDVLVTVGSLDRKVPIFITRAQQTFKRKERVCRQARYFLPGVNFCDFQKSQAPALLIHVTCIFISCVIACNGNTYYQTILRCAYPIIYKTSTSLETVLFLNAETSRN